MWRSDTGEDSLTRSCRVFLIGATWASILSMQRTFHSPSHAAYRARTLTMDMVQEHSRCRSPRWPFSRPAII
jgi:hypothetical protein